jgi:beta-glucosidase
MMNNGLAERVDSILSEATLEEKVGMMSGKGFFQAYSEDQGVWGARPYRAGSGLERLGVEPLYFTDGPRGVARGQSTCFPCTMARGASFDVDLEHRIGQAMGIEVRAQGCTLSGAVCINLLRHPAWGRAQETYGEDQFHLGAMGSALGTGIQAHGVIATVKHFALNSMENARFTVNVKVDERTLHEVYLPHFKACVDAGVASVMSAYNKVNGEYCGQHRELLTDILRHEWGFAGFVHSDWVMGVYHPYGAAAGLDIENPEPLRWGEKLVTAVKSGAIEPGVIDTACRRILTTQLQFAAAEPPLEDYSDTLVAGDAHCALALEAAEKSAVLLENDGVLPLARGARLAVLGRLAAIENTGDNGSSRVRAPEIVTPLKGLIAYAGEDMIAYADESDLNRCTDLAKAADATVVVVGYTAEEEGEFIPGDLALGQAGSEASLPPEIAAARKSAPPRPKSIGGDRLDLGLPESQQRMIEAAAAAGKPVIVVIIAGSAVLVEAWRDQANAILQTFYSGMAGGTALARLLFGDVSPSGKLPFTVARSADDYPHFDREAAEITYSYWHGYAKFEQEGLTPRYPFGHGLSYARFSYRSLRVRPHAGRIGVSVAVLNDGQVRATEIVQAYVGFPDTVEPRARKLLKAFQRVDLEPGETKIVAMTIATDDLRYRDPSTHSWRLEAGEHRILVGGSSTGALRCASVIL